MKELQPNTMQVLNAFCFMKDDNGNIVEDFEGMCDRVSKRIATFTVDPTPGAQNACGPDFEKWYKKYYDLQYNQEFLANLPVYFNIGNKIEMGSACFILPVGDSIKEIYQAVREGAIIGKLGGGIGMAFDDLRSTGTITSSGGIASGALSFMTAWQNMNRTIAQGGRRRGAMMGQLRVTHPEILHFIDCKHKTKPERTKYLAETYNLSKEQAEQILVDTDWVAPYSEFNLTVKITDEFWDAAREGRRYNLYNPEWTKGSVKVTDPRGLLAPVFEHIDGKKVPSLPAKEVWDRIVESAWDSGEPGVAFIDRINRDNPVPQLGKIATSNPCGEYWQVPYSSCILGSINLAKFDHGTDVDWSRLQDAVVSAVHFLNAIIDINEYPIPEIKKVTLASRPIGLGVMGWADLLLKLGIRYGSTASFALAEKVMLFINYHAWSTSVDMAAKYGAYPCYHDSYDSNMFFLEKLGKLEKDYMASATKDWPFTATSLTARVRTYGARNCQVTTIAPTGTIALLAECSSGIEPIFAFVLIRQDGVGKREYVHWFKTYMETQHPGKDWPDYAIAAHQVTPEEHVHMQAAFQKYCDNAVSKTVNLPHDATVDDVRKVYELAYETGCKSVTVYRDGCREGVLLLKKEVVKVNDSDDTIPEADPHKWEQALPQVESNGYMHRPNILPGATWKLNTPHGTVYVTVNYDPELKKILEVFILENTGNEAWQLTGRLLSLLLRLGIPIQKITKQLNRTLGQSTIVLDGHILNSVAQAVAHVLELAQEYFSHPAVPIKATKLETAEVSPGWDRLDKICPDCGRRTLVHAEGCIRCLSCPYNKCGG